MLVFFIRGDIQEMVRADYEEKATLTADSTDTSEDQLLKMG
jgi:hypothetical protein